MEITIGRPGLHIACNLEMLPDTVKLIIKTVQKKHIVTITPG